MDGQPDETVLVLISMSLPSVQVASEHVDQLIGSEEFASTIGNFDRNFSTLLVSLLDQLSLFSATDCEHNMTNIIHRLDFNGFYTEGLERLAAERRSKEREEDLQDQGGSEAVTGPDEPVGGGT